MKYVHYLQKIFEREPGYTDFEYVDSVVDRVLNFVMLLLFFALLLLLLKMLKGGVN